jgi:hypothetical protein
MAWTDERPTTSGWYWWQQNRAAPAEAVWVGLMDDAAARALRLPAGTMCVRWAGDAAQTPLAALGGRWDGPISPPDAG